MPRQFLAYLIEPSDKTHTTRHPFSTPITLLIVALSIFTVLWALVPLFRLDFEVVLFLRSIHIQAIDDIGEIGNALGHGITLILITVGIAIVGYAWKRDRFIRAGCQGLIAYALAGLIIRIIKILLGRPRPRFMHQDHWQIWPSLQGGLDTFPSGHSAASFAVAAVLARHFPKGAWVWYGAAGFVAISRIVRGSHFPSDALAGSLVGFLVGYIFARPLKDWLISILEALKQGLPFWVGGFALVWIIFHFPQTSLLRFGMFWVGLTMIALSFGVRIFLILKPGGTKLEIPISSPTTNLILGLGMALYTESLLVALLAFCTGIIVWMGQPPNETAGNPGSQIVPKVGGNLAQEAWIGLALFVLLFGIQQLKGLIPLK